MSGRDFEFVVDEPDVPDMETALLAYMLRDGYSGDEAAALLEKMSAPAVVLRALSRRCHNGAGDPWQSFYNDGLALVLERMANHLDYHAERRAEVTP